jgi:tetratricopeptide (TPR) repeat protein
MKQTLAKALERIHKAEKAGRIEQALSELDQLIVDWPANPPLLRLRARLIQLGDDSAPTLEEAKECLRQAADLDAESPIGWLELAQYALNVEDDAKNALKAFDKSIRQSEEFLTEALAGKAKALAELKQREQALACLAEAYWVQSHRGERPSSNGTNVLRSLEELRLAE